MRSRARDLFSGIAPNYDGPAEVFSLFQYSRWHSFLLSQLRLSDPARVLDVATGTGAVALKAASRLGVQVVGADITGPMLRRAMARGAALGLERRLQWVECDAEALPFADAAFDAVTATYLLRYVSDVPETVAELSRVLKPGGMILYLDFAVPRGVAGPLWRLHTSLVLPLGGALLSPGWRRVGGFLGGSIRRFCREWPEGRLLALWRELGFADVQAKRLSLGGALAIWGRKVP
ncbi:MAG TPA: class I SAM-dependent methyltransferase [Dehalococcoidia bacterium]|nr:class I SAM-dependent methyltransferase [Dehalococcoidia bacterium]